jgi:serine O-acetyltransferase
MGPLRRTWALIISDYRRYRATSRGTCHSWAIPLLVQGFWASSVYRLAHGVNRSLRLPGLRWIARVFFMFAQKWMEIVTGIALPPETMIGPGLYIGHFGGIIVSGRVKIGANCNLSQGVTLGLIQGGERSGVPVIGNRVYIGPQAILIGGLAVGDDAVIGAGAVVTQSVPDRGVVAGNPARLISTRGSFDLIHYDGREQDPGRIASLQKVQPRDGRLRLITPEGSRKL